MAEHKIASRYSKPFVALAVEKGLLEIVKDDVNFFKETCDVSRELRLLLKNPIVGNTKKFQVLKALFAGKVNDFTLKFFELICKKSREKYLYEIAADVVAIYHELKGIQKADITTAVPLSASQKQSSVKLVEKLSNGKQVLLSEKIDTDIIGGFILNVGDVQIDTSIATKLKKLEVSFATAQ
jgi:F-type H+-transporting ATPase subunit delta